MPCDLVKLGKPNERKVMKVMGAVFREPLRGRNKGLLSIMITKTQQTVYVTSDEMVAYETAAAGMTKSP